MNHYVKIKSPESLLSVATQKCAPTGKTRVEGNRTYAEFIPLDKGYYKDKFWATKDQIVP